MAKDAERFLRIVVAPEVFQLGVCLDYYRLVWSCMPKRWKAHKVSGLGWGEVSYIDLTLVSVELARRAE